MNAPQSTEQQGLDPALVKLYGRDAARFHQLLTIEANVGCMKAAVQECLTMLESVAELKDENGDWLLYRHYVDPFGAINDARRSIGLPPINWKNRDKTALKEVT